MRLVTAAKRLKSRALREKSHLPSRARRLGQVTRQRGRAWPRRQKQFTHPGIILISRLGVADGRRPPPSEGDGGRRARRRAFMKTQGEIEAAISDGVTRFEQEYMGRGPKDIRTWLLGDLLVVRLQGVLTAAEQQLVKTGPPEKGRDLLKQVRTQLIEAARPLLVAMVEQATGGKVVSLHHDISTVTGEEVVLFGLAAAPEAREARKR
jgi:uncharacterized protein YbcI